MSRLNTRIYVLPLVKGKEESYPIENLSLIDINKDNNKESDYCGSFMVGSDELTRRLLECSKLSLIARDSTAGYSTIIHDVKITNTNENRFFFTTSKVIHLNISQADLSDDSVY